MHKPAETHVDVNKLYSMHADMPTPVCMHVHTLVILIAHT